MAGASKVQLDFTNVKDGGGSFNKKRQEPGDYKAKVIKVQDAKSKADGVSMWLFTIQVGAGTYPYYCKHDPNQLWKIRNLFVAAGINVPKKRVAVDPNKIIGRTIAVTLDDEEYEGKMQSVVAATFPVSELDSTEDDDDDEEEDDDTEEDEVEEEGDDDDEEEEVVEAPPAKKNKKGKKSKKVDDVEDDELEELDIEEI